MSMARLSRSELASYTQSLRARRGALPAEADNGEIVVHPPGTPVPTQPGRTPTRSIPRTRNPGALVETLTDFACSLYNPAPGGFIDRYLDFSEYTNSRSVADGLLRLICGDPPGSPAPSGGGPSEPPPPVTNFSGGQCPGDTYRVNYTVTAGGNPLTTFEDVTGPIFSITLNVLRNPNGSPAAVGPRIEHAGPGGVGREVTLGFGQNALGVQEGDWSLNVGAIVNRTNPGDDCGDPPAEPADPPGAFNPPDPLPPVTYDPDDGGPPVTVNPEIGIGVGLGGPQLEFRLGDVNINIDVGGVDINFPGAPAECCPPDALRPGPEDVAPDPEEPVEPPPPEVPPNEDPNEETNRVFRAVIVTLRNLNSPATPLRPANGSPTVFAPRAGTLQFKISTADGATGWTGDIDLKNAQQYVEVPAIQGAIDARVFPYGTANVTITRIYQTIDSSISQVTT